MAQLCDARTAVSLARSDCDKRWFLKPKMHNVLKNTKNLLKDIEKLLEEMLPNKCISYFLHTHANFNLRNVKEPDTDDLFVAQGHSLPKNDVDLLRKCVDEFLHLSINKQYSRDFIRHGGLQILIELWKIFNDDKLVKCQIANIISNLSVCNDLVEDFFVTGWIRILSEWMRDSCLKVQLMATKTLANLDRDDRNNFEYGIPVYPLYPNYRKRQKPEADIIFIHGLLGNLYMSYLKNNL